MEKRINSKEAYLAAFEFLGDLYDQHEQDDLGVLLGGMKLNTNDDDSRDSAMRSIWLELVETRFAGQRDFDLYESYELMLLFLANVNSTMNSRFLTQLMIDLREHILTETELSDWEIAVDKVIDKNRL